MNNEIYLIMPYENIYAKNSEDFLRKRRKYLTYYDVNNKLEDIWYIVNDKLEYFVINKRYNYFTPTVSSNNSKDHQYYIDTKFTKSTTKIDNNITKGLYVVKAKSKSIRNGYQINKDKLYIFYYDGDSKYKLYLNGKIYEHNFKLNFFQNVFEVLYKLDNKKNKLNSCNKYNVKEVNGTYKISIPYSPYYSSLFYNLRNINKGVSFHSNVKFRKNENQNFLQIDLTNPNIKNKKLKKSTIIIEENNGKMNNTTFISILESINSNQIKNLVKAIKEYKKILKQINESKPTDNLHEIKNNLNTKGLNKNILKKIGSLIIKKKSNKIIEWGKEEAAAKAKAKAAAQKKANVIKKIQQQGQSNKLQNTKKQNANSVKKALFQQSNRLKVTKNNLNSTGIKNNELFNIYSKAFNNNNVKN